MSSTGSQYVVQNLPDRYIRSRVLDDYINERLDEFGHHWTRTVYLPRIQREWGGVTARLYPAHTWNEADGPPNARLFEIITVSRF